MNYVCLTPHFPPNYYLFAVNLARMGVRVLGLADEPYEWLKPELQGALTEYYRVDDMRNYDLLLRACGYLTHRYGKIDRLDSHTEYWMETEARLRSDFNVFGPKEDQVARIKRKSFMKQAFVKAGVAPPDALFPAAPGVVTHAADAAVTPLTRARRTGRAAFARRPIATSRAATPACRIRRPRRPRRI